jgi:hypothetical protein
MTAAKRRSPMPDAPEDQGQRLEPLTPEELDRLRDSHFDPRIIQPDMSVQRLIVSLDLALAQKASILEIMQRTSANVARPRLEAEVLFLVGSLCQDLMMGPAEDQSMAIGLMARAVNEVALSRAGKLDLNLLKWTEEVGLAERDKPAIRTWLGPSPLQQPPPMGPDGEGSINPEEEPKP